MKQSSLIRCLTKSYNKQNDPLTAYGQHAPADQLKRALMSLFVDHQQKTEHTIKQLQSQLKHKVNKSQFLSAMGTKLSMSDVSNLYADRGKNQGKLTVRAKQKQRQTILQEAKVNQTKMLEQFEAKLDQTLLDQASNVQARLNIWKPRFDQMWDLKDQVSAKISSVQKQRREKILELQQIIFDKAERNQMNKLFKLHDLILIQMEQLKERLFCIQKSHESHKTSQEHLQDLLSNFKQEDKKEKQLLARQIQENCMKLEKSVNQTLDLVQMREREFQNEINIASSRSIEANTQNLEGIIYESISDCRKMIVEISKVQELHQQVMKEQEIRMNLFDLKDGQFTRSLTDMQSLKEKVVQTITYNSTLEQDFQGFKEKFNDRIKQIIQTQQKGITAKIVQQMEQIHQDLMEKVSEMFGQAVRREDFDKQIYTLKQKHKIMEELDYKVVEKIADLEDRIQVSRTKLQQNNQKNTSSLQKLFNELKDRIRIQEVKKIVQNLTTGEEIREITLNLQQKLRQEIQFTSLKQQKLNQTLCSQNVVGRWLWTAGELKGGNLICWDKQIINTLPENFKWKRQQKVISIISSGLYRIQLGFYSRKKPTIQVIVNGQTVISAVNNGSYVLHHSSGKLKDIQQTGNQSIGQHNVTGITLIDFFMLPENARIAISYAGQYIGEGFLGIQRL